MTDDLLHCNGDVAVLSTSTHDCAAFKSGKGLGQGQQTGSKPGFEERMKTDEV